jgi:1-acyl-sn-glycerol-3-phosphate acyltransferase
MKPVYRFAHTLSRVIGTLYFRMRVVHRELFPETGGALVVANHVSYLDPPLIGCCFRKPIYCLARKSLFRGFFAWFLPRINVLPVDRGKPDMAGMKRVLQLLKEGNRVLLFPEGTRSVDGNLLPAEAGVGFIIAKCGVPVVPVRISGAFECYPRSAAFPKPGKITITAGPPVDFSAIPKELTGRELYQAYADAVMAAIGRIEPG